MVVRLKGIGGRGAASSHLGLASAPYREERSNRRAAMAGRVGRQTLVQRRRGRGALVLWRAGNRRKAPAMAGGADETTGSKGADRRG